MTLALSLLAAFAFAQEPAPAANPPAQAPAQVDPRAGEPTGTWAIAEAESVIQERIAAVVQEAANAFNFLIRSIARSRIERGATWCHTYAFINNDDAIGWSCDGKAPVTTPRSQLGVRRTIDVLGEPTDVKMTEENGILRATFYTDTGSRTQTFHPLPNGQLRLDAQIESSKLDAPIKWSILYKGGTIRGR